MLTKQEIEVIRLVLDGCSNKQIAKALYITPKTVGFHLSNIYRKTHVCSKVELVVSLIRKNTKKVLVFTQNITTDSKCQS